MFQVKNSVVSNCGYSGRVITTCRRKKLDFASFAFAWNISSTRTHMMKSWTISLISTKNDGFVSFKLGLPPELLEAIYSGPEFFAESALHHYRRAYGFDRSFDKGFIVS